MHLPSSKPLKRSCLFAVVGASLALLSTSQVWAAPAEQAPAEQAPAEQAIEVEAPASSERVIEVNPQESRGTIRGVVKHAQTAHLLGEDVVLILRCACMSGERTARTNARGIYQFDDLLPGQYTVDAISGKARVTKLLELPRAAKYQVNFSINPEDHADPTVLAEPISTVYSNPNRKLPVVLDAIPHSSTQVLCVEEHRPSVAFPLQYSMFNDGGLRQIQRRPPIRRRL